VGEELITLFSKSISSLFLLIIFDICNQHELISGFAKARYPNFKTFDEIAFKEVIRVSV
jgi:hypothetical protein